MNRTTSYVNSDWVQIQDTTGHTQNNIYAGKHDNLNGLFQIIMFILPHLTSKDSFLRHVSIATCVS